MPTFLDLNFDDTYEPKTIAADTEVRMRIANAVLGAKKDDADARRLEITLTDPADDEFKDFTTYLVIPKPDGDKKKANAQKMHIRDFYSCFGIDTTHGGVVVEDMIGKEGWVVLGLDNDPEYGKKNNIRRFIVGH